MGKRSVIAIVMGSKNDEVHIEPTLRLLDEFGLAWEKHAISAHRQPDKLREYVREAEKNGVKIFIAAAGLSAALPGVIAAHTQRPVIGVPVPGGPLGGMDALLATVQMPGGVPVATVGLGSHGAKNAAILALEILALSDESLSEKLRQYREKLQTG